MSNSDDGLSIPGRVEAMNLIDDAMGNDTKEFPFGMFLRDDGGYGRFLWYDTEESLLAAVERNVFALFPDDGEEEDAQISAALKAIIDGVSSQPKIGEELRKKVDEYLGNVSLCMGWIGTFKQVCEGSGELESEVRQQFREHIIDDFEDMSDDELTRPITTEEMSEFVEFIGNSEF